MSAITHMSEDDLEAFLEDDDMEDMSAEIFGPHCDLCAQGNGKIVRVYDLYGWNEYYNHGDITSLIAIEGKIKRLADIHRLNAIQEIEVEGED